MSIRLCGRFGVDLHGRALDDELPGQRRLLFAYLAATGGRAVSRGELTDALWPVRPPKAPDAALSVVLSKLRRALGADLIVGSTELFLDLPGGAEIDVEVARRETEAARSALERHDWPTARTHATTTLDVLDGDFLAGFEAPWIDERRRELEELRAWALECLGQAGLALGGAALAPAERAGRDLVESWPYRESGYRLLMEALAARGAPAEALLVFDRLRTLLRDELGVAPSRALQELHTALLHGGLPAREADRRHRPARIRELPLPRALERLAAGPFVGRQAELSWLARCWESTLSGQCIVALVAGEPGIGKTRLTAELAALVHRRGAAVLYGSTERHAPLSPYEPIADALRSLASEAPPHAFATAREQGHDALFRLVPELFERAPAPGEHAIEEPTLERQRLFQAIDAMLRGITRRSPTLLALDDLHWAERPALALLTHIVRSVEDAPLLVIATYRPTDLSADHALVEALAELRRLASVEATSLSGLGEGDLAELVSALTGSDDPHELASGLHAATDGNPLFVTEALRHLAEGVPLEVALGAGRGRAPGGLEQVIAGRLSRLGAASRQALSLASVAGREFELGVLEQAAGAEGDGLLDALEEAVAAGLLAEVAGRPGRFAFSHALVRDFLYRTLGEARRARLHGRIGEALERFHRGDTDPHLVDLADHFMASARLGGDPVKGLRYGTAAARRAVALFAWEEAEARFRSVLTERKNLRLRLVEADFRRLGREASQGLGDALATMGRHADAVESYHAGLGDAIDDPIARARLHRKAGIALVRLNRYGEAHEAFDAAERALVDAPASVRGAAWNQEQAQVLLDRIPLLYWEDRVADMEGVIRRARSLVERNGTPAQRARLLESRCQLGLRRERYVPSDETTRLAEAALAASEEAGWTHGTLWSKQGLGFCRLWSGDLDGARDTLGEALAAAERAGHTAVSVRCLAYLTVAARRRGDTAATARLAERTMAAAKASGAETYVASSKANLAWAASRRGNLAEARALAREALDIWDRLPSEYMFRWLAVWPLVAADLELENGEQALREAARLLEHGQQALPEPLERLISAATSAEDEGRADEAQRALHGALELAEAFALA